MDIITTVPLTLKEEFEVDLKLKKLNPFSIKQYLYYLSLFKKTSNEIYNQETVNMFLTKYNTSIGRAFLNNFRSFLIRSKKVSNLQEVREVELPKISGRTKRKIPKILTEEEIRLMELKMKNERGRVMLLLSFYCGLRKAGLLNIKPYDFNWSVWEKNPEKFGRLRITEKGEKERIVLVPPWLMQKTFHFISEKAKKKPDSKESYLFEIKRQRWQDVLLKAGKEALNKRVNPHILRHSNATWLLSNGFTIEEVKEFLGHESIVTTQIYIHLNQDKLERKLEHVLREVIIEHNTDMDYYEAEPHLEFKTGQQNQSSNDSGQKSQSEQAEKTPMNLPEQSPTDPAPSQ